VDRPFLGLRLTSISTAIARLLLELGDRGMARRSPPTAAYSSLRMDRSSAGCRSANGETARYAGGLAVLAPALQREIYYRVLRGELGQRLVDLAECDGGNHRHRPRHRMAQAAATRPPLRIRGAGRRHAHSSVCVASSFQGGHCDVPAASTRSTCAARSAADDVRRTASNAPPPGIGVGYEALRSSAANTGACSVRRTVEIARLREAGAEA